MKIFYISVIEQNAGWGAECFVNRGFLRNGHETITLDYRKNRHNLAKNFLYIEKDFDVLFLQRGDWFPLELLEAVNRPRIFWASELVDRNRDQDRLFSSGLFDHFYVRTQRCKKIILNNGWASEEKISVLLSGFDENVQYKLPDVDKDIDILFVGNIMPRRREWLDYLKQYFPTFEANAYGHEMTALFNRSKIVLNIHVEQFKDTETRVFEALGCGAFLLSEKLSSDNPFISGVHFVEADDLDQMLKKIDYYLINSKEREEIACAGHEEALSRHTYTHRAKQIADLFSTYIKPTSQLPINIRKVKSYGNKEFFIRQMYRTEMTLRDIKRLIYK